MLRTLSPLRYPGGKSCLYELAAEILRVNKLDRVQYAEPYAGGCGLALSLLYGGHVSDVYLNDLDPSIWSFWQSAIYNTDEFVNLVRKTPLNIREWHRQKEVYSSSDKTHPLALGFATFYLNRTNRSGVIKGGGVIGGLSQNGSYKLDCRFNREDLVKRIQRVARYRNRINVFNLDALEFMSMMSSTLEPRSFLYIDPPYFNRGSKLYTNFYNPGEHSQVAEAVLGLRQPWIVTYDYTQEITRLYAKRRQLLFDINYSIQTKRVGMELLIASKGLRIPPTLKELHGLHLATALSCGATQALRSESAKGR